MRTIDTMLSRVRPAERFEGRNPVAAHEQPFKHGQRAQRREVADEVAVQVKIGDPGGRREQRDVPYLRRGGA